jgi:hypothetical protein
MRFHSKKVSSVFIILALAIASMMWIGIESPKHQRAVAQSPMNMMEMMMGGGGNNMTGGTMMMGNGNMSMPFNMGVVIMPTMCTTPSQMLGSLSGMFGDEMDGDNGNATQQQMMMEMMRQQMMSGGGMGMQNIGMQNMSGTELQQMSEIGMQQAMDLQICFPMIGEGMMQHMQDMMSNGQNALRQHLTPEILSK